VIQRSMDKKLVLPGIVLLIALSVLVVFHNSVYTFFPGLFILNDVLPLPTENYRHPMQVEYYSRANVGWLYKKSQNKREIDFILKEFSKGKIHDYLAGDDDLARLQPSPSAENNELMIIVRRLSNEGVLLELRSNELLLREDSVFLKRVFPGSPGRHEVTSVTVSEKLRDFLLAKYTELKAESAFEEPVGDKPLTLFSQGSFIMNELLEIAEAYGFDSGILLSLVGSEAELLLYHSRMSTKAELAAKRININERKKVLSEVDMFFPEEMLGYSLGFKYFNASAMSYLVGYRSLVSQTDKMQYSDLLVIDKNFPPLGVKILQSYSTDYDAASGIIPQGIIPTIIDFTLELAGDYLVFQDVDLHWKAQSIETGEMFNSNETGDSAHGVEAVYTSTGQYIYILQYVADNSFLVFNVSGQEFVVKKPYQLKDVEFAAVFNEIGDKVLLELKSDDIAAVKKAFNEGFDSIRPFVFGDEGWSPGLAISINAEDKQWVHIYKLSFGENGQFLISYVAPHDGWFIIDHYLFQSDCLQVIFDSIAEKIQ